MSDDLNDEGVVHTGFCTPVFRYIRRNYIALGLGTIIIFQIINMGLFSSIVALVNTMEVEVMNLDDIVNNSLFPITRRINRTILHVDDVVDGMQSVLNGIQYDVGRTLQNLQSDASAARIYGEYFNLTLTSILNDVDNAKIALANKLTEMDNDLHEIKQACGGR